MRHLSMRSIVLLALIALQMAHAEERVELTLDSAVNIMMNNSYRVKNLVMNIERTRYHLQAELAGLKSSVFMNLITPNLNKTSDYKWNSTLQRNEIVRENTNRWQMDFAIRQPIILLGYPTNGNVSLNYKIWRYNQADGESYTSFYNRLYMRLEQPFFLANEKKNDLEEAQLDLENEELEYISDQVDIIRDVSNDYYELLELEYRDVILLNCIDYLERVHAIINGRDSTGSLESKQVKLQLANAREELLANQSELRISKAHMVQRLRLDEHTEIVLHPELHIVPITVDQEQAIEYGYTLRPRMRMLSIDKRQSEIRLENVKSYNAFHVNLNITYGLEKEDERVLSLWQQYDNSNSVTVEAYLPLWDWGRRRAQIEASKISLKQVDLTTEEEKARIRSDIINAITNLKEHQIRAVNMEKSVEMAKDIIDASIVQFTAGEISLQELFQVITIQKDTEINFLDAYLHYRRSLLSLMANTYYDYEKDVSLLDELRSTYSAE